MSEKKDSLKELEEKIDTAREYGLNVQKSGKNWCQNSVTVVPGTKL